VLLILLCHPVKNKLFIGKDGNAVSTTPARRDTPPCPLLRFIVRIDRYRYRIRCDTKPVSSILSGMQKQSISEQGGGNQSTTAEIWPAGQGNLFLLHGSRAAIRNEANPYTVVRPYDTPLYPYQDKIIPLAVRSHIAYF
jgi:hypothetical protein